MPDPASEPFFRLEIARLRRHFSVRFFSAVEAISQPFKFELEVSGDEIDLASLMYMPAFLSFNGSPQGFHGQIQGATRMHYRPGPACYRLTLGPRLACLDHRYNQRVFQQLSATQIIALVLKEHGLGESCRFDLKTQCRTRETCFQHNESDLSFIQRLCAEEHIHYHFHHSRRRHELVFSEGLRGFRRAPIAPWRQFAHQPGVTQFSVTRVGSDAPGSRTDQRAQGESTLPFVNSGLLLPLAGLAERDWNHMWLITQVEHHVDLRPAEAGLMNTPYLNRFQAVPWEVGFRTPAPATRSVVTGLQRAWITGAPGELQQRDSSGRVQVQFEWGTQHIDARYTTCWLPVTKALHLSCRGATQVVAHFKVDDPDNPVIVATLQTGTSTPLSLLGSEANRHDPAPVQMQLDWQAVLGNSHTLHVDDGSKLHLDRGSDLTLQVGASQVRIDADGVTLTSPRIVLDSELPPHRPDDSPD
ncbi:type IV secretion protein Rhs [Pseudomonas viridiflava]|uniref:type VI secretion system Vgr family protein n=1 Tax=Pseudomonas viridiflava TaxID=33069 RepID=UPI0015E370D6|nr:contractile injection system protein, VgrG/Pvc8 family [Pseudomonas viridiflava]MBA1230453.1 type IV secretion protein Rhs [Pseudomonas viridiflava]